MILLYMCEYVTYIFPERLICISQGEIGQQGETGEKGSTGEKVSLIQYLR